jgi:hypothetical protein
LTDEKDYLFFSIFLLLPAFPQTVRRIKSGTPRGFALSPFEVPEQVFPVIQMPEKT